MTSAYPKTSALARQMLAAAREESVPDRFDKGGLGALLLAQCLNHKLAVSDKGFDGIDSASTSYEYKCSITDQFNFHFGARKDHDCNDATIDKHFAGLAGAICARREFDRITKAVFVPSASLVAHLKAHFKCTDGGQVNKNFSMKQFQALTGAEDWTSRLQQ